MKKAAFQKFENFRHDTESYEFEILMTNDYPQVYPQILCHTSINSAFMSLNDGRDLFCEVLGE